MGLWVYLCITGIDSVHLGLQFVDVFLTDGRGGCLLPWELDPFGDKRDGVFRAHAEAGVVGYQSGLLPPCMMAVVIAATDEQYLTVGEPIEVVVIIDAYLAHEHLEHVVGGAQFFGLSPLSVAGCCCSDATTSGTLYHSLRSLPMVPTRLVTSSDVA